jgi:hypothetical protein
LCNKKYLFFIAPNGSLLIRHVFASGGQGKEGSWEAEKIGSWEKIVNGNDIA